MNKAALITIIAMLTFGVIVAMVKRSEMKQEEKERVEKIWKKYEASIEHNESCYTIERLQAEHRLLEGGSAATYAEDLDKAFNKWINLNVYYKNKLEEDLRQ